MEVFVQWWIFGEDKGKSILFHPLALTPCKGTFQ